MGLDAWTNLQGFLQKELEVFWLHEGTEGADRSIEVGTCFRSHEEVRGCEGMRFLGDGCLSIVKCMSE